MNNRGRSMATWVTHFRIAETLLHEEPSLDRIAFLVGNIGPDCGLVGEDGRPVPPKSITHFKQDGQLPSELFKQQYLNDLEQASNVTRSYLLGYYLHLVTDEHWIQLTTAKKRESPVQEIVGTPDYTRLVKTDWYGVDFQYLATHPEHIFWTDFRHVQSFEDVLPFFPQGQTAQQIRNITTFYETHTLEANHVFRYMHPHDIDLFIDRTLVALRSSLSSLLRQSV